MTITIDSPICPDCFGYGATQHRGSQAPCERCHGVGRIESEPEPTEPTQIELREPVPDTDAAGNVGDADKGVEP